jgi:hypothetical protein
VIHSSEMLVATRTTWQYVSEDDILIIFAVLVVVVVAANTVT